MVFSPLILFIFLLLALVIVVWFYKYFNKTPVIEIQEPLVAFESRMKAGATIPSANELPPYSGNLPNKKIAKIYDNIFYDIDNGNLIEVDSPGIGKTGSISTSTPTSTPTPTSTQTRSTATPTKTNQNDISLEPTDDPITTDDPTATDDPTDDPIEPFTQEGLTPQTQTQMPNNNKKVDIKTIWISRRQDAGTPVVEYSGDPDQYDPKGRSESRLELVNSYNHFVYKTRSENTDRYTVLYVAWLDGTFITMINLDTNELVTTQLFSSVGTTSNTLLYNQSSLNPLSPKIPITIDNSPTNNKYILLNKYDGQVHVFQLSSNIYFDPRNAQLIALDPTSNNITVFSRIGTIIPNGYLNNTEYDTTSVFNSWTYYDKSGTKMVLYISFDEITLIILLESDSNTGYRIYNVQRFDKNGVDTGTNTEITRPTSTAPKSTEPKVDGNVVHDGNNRSCSVRYWSNPDGKFMNKTGSGSECDTLINHNNKPSNNNNNDMNPISMPNSTNMMNDYYQWYYNWVKNGKKDLPSQNHMYSEDYMLKTQIVPPVCPACSTSLGTCVNCSSGNSFTGGDSMFYNPWLNIYSKDKNIPTFTTSGNAIANKNNIHEDDCDLCSECSEENTKANVITNTNTISPFKYNNYRKQDDYNRQDFEEEGDFGEENGGFGQKNGGYDRPPNGGDFMGEEGDFMGKEGDFGDEEGDFGDEEGDFGNPTSNKVMDPYSYFNSVPSKGSNFVPILSDFSKFGR